MLETATLNECKSFIDGLGDLGTGVKLKDRLLKEGYKGQPRDSEDDPLCKYLEKELPGWHFSISVDEIAGWRIGHPVRLLVKTPPSIAQFVERFDKGKYESLIA